MRLIIGSDTKNIAQELLAELGHLAKGKVIVVDSAAMFPEKIRGGSAAQLYGAAGADLQVLDPLKGEVIDLTGVDVLHFSGGDPFQLNRACQMVGLREMIEGHIDRHDLTVVGISAGAMILGDDLSHAGILCKAKSEAEKIGFGWIAGRVMPHMDMAGARADGIRAHVAENPQENWTLLMEKSCEAWEVDLSGPEIGVA